MPIVISNEAYNLQKKQMSLTINADEDQSIVYVSFHLEDHPTEIQSDRQHRARKKAKEVLKLVLEEL